MKHEERVLKGLVTGEGLFRSQVSQGGTDLLVSCDKDIAYIAEKALKQTRIDLTKYLAREPKFETSHIPVRAAYNAPKLIGIMASAASKVKTGPMAAFPGAVAETVCREMLKNSSEAVVENGSDIYMKISRPRMVAPPRPPSRSALAIVSTSGNSGMRIYLVFTR